MDLKNKRRMVYVCTMALLVAWLAASTPVIAKVINKDRLRVVRFKEYEAALLQKEPYCSLSGTVDGIQYCGDILEKIRVNGWALLETEQDNSSRHVSLILNSDRNCYELLLDMEERPDVLVNLKKILKRGELHVPTNQVGFSGEFSTLSMGDGVYDIYVFCWENETDFGIKNTGYQLEKSGADCKISPWQGIKTEAVLQVTGEEKTIGNLEILSLESSYIRVSGWECIEHKDSRSQTVYVQFESFQGGTQLYKAKNVYSGDVMRAKSDDLYAQCRYFMSIPQENVADGLYRITVFVENDGAVQCSIPYLMAKTDGKITYGYEGDGEAVSRVIGAMPVNNLGLGGEIVQSYLTWDGACVIVVQAENPEVLSGAEAMCLKVNQTDGSETYMVADVLNNIQVTIPAGQWNAVESVQLCIVDKGYLHIDEHQLAFSPYAMYTEQTQLSPAHDEKWTKPQIAVVKEINDNLLISGWTVVEGEDSKSQTNYIRLDYPDGSVAYMKALTVFRPDVSLYLNDERCDWTGFYAYISKEYLEPYPITFRIGTDTGEAFFLSADLYSAQARREGEAFFE